MPNIITENVLTLSNAASGNYFQSVDQVNKYYRAIQLYIDVIQGGTLLPVLLAKDPFTGLYFPIATAPALSAGQYLLNMTPTATWTTIAIGGGSIAAGTQYSYPGYLPAIWAVGATIASANVSAQINASLSD